MKQLIIRKMAELQNVIWGGSPVEGFDLLELEAHPEARVYIEELNRTLCLAKEAPKKHQKKILKYLHKKLHDILLYEHRNKNIWEEGASYGGIGPGHIHWQTSPMDEFEVRVCQLCGGKIFAGSREGHNSELEPWAEEEMDAFPAKPVGDTPCRGGFDGSTTFYSSDAVEASDLKEKIQRKNKKIRAHRQTIANLERRLLDYEEEIAALRENQKPCSHPQCPKKDGLKCGRPGCPGMKNGQCSHNDCHVKKAMAAPNGLKCGHRGCPGMKNGQCSHNDCPVKKAMAAPTYDKGGCKKCGLTADKSMEVIKCNKQDCPGIKEGKCSDSQCPLKNSYDDDSFFQNYSC